MVPLDIDLRQVEKSNPDICYKIIPRKKIKKNENKQNRIRNSHRTSQRLSPTKLAVLSPIRCVTRLVQPQRFVISINMAVVHNSEYLQNYN